MNARARIIAPTNKTCSARAKIEGAERKASLRGKFEVRREDLALLFRGYFWVGDAVLVNHTLVLRARIVPRAEAVLSGYFSTDMLRTEGNVKTFDHAASNRTQRILQVSARIIR